MIASDGCLFACGGAAYTIVRAVCSSNYSWGLRKNDCIVTALHQCGLLFSFPVPTVSVGCCFRSLSPQATFLDFPWPPFSAVPGALSAVHFLRRFQPWIFILTMNSLSTNVIWWFWYNMMIVKVEWSSMCFRHVRSPYLHCRYRWCFLHTQGVFPLPWRARLYSRCMRFVDSSRMTYSLMLSPYSSSNQRKLLWISQVIITFSL